jgi:hypothetical protein
MISIVIIIIITMMTVIIIIAVICLHTRIQSVYERIIREKYM